MFSYLNKRKNPELRAICNRPQISDRGVPITSYKEALKEVVGTASRRKRRLWTHPRIQIKTRYVVCILKGGVQFVVEKVMENIHLRSCLNVEDNELKTEL